MFKSRLFLLSVFCSFFSALQAQEANVKKAFESILKNYYQEKVYLHTDKPYYISGEDIWFKAYLLDACTHRNGMSNFLYVELADKSGDILRRVKIKKDSLGVYGKLTLPEELSSGDYQLRAYSWWMQNLGEDFFFKKNIAVENVIKKRIQITPHYEALNDGKIKVTLTVKDASGAPLNGKEFDLILLGDSKYIRTNKEGKADFTIDAKKSDDSALYYNLQAHKNAAQYDERFHVPPVSQDYHVSFFPESGNLLAGESQFVAFKAIGADGLSKKVSGTIHGENGEEIAQVTAIHKGMGKFILMPEENKKYYAEIEDESGIKRRFDLPVVQSSGIGLQLSRRGEIVRYRITNTTQVANDNLFLVIHLRGKPFIINKLSDESLAGSINMEGIPAGIVTFSVVDDGQRVFCERLYFANGKKGEIDVKTDRTSYEKRQPVDMDFMLKDSKGNPVVGNFSLSITDVEVVTEDSLSDNILSNLLLTSDLRGYIEDPGYYFLSEDNAKREALDLLLMTQGWTRFDLEDVFKVPVPSIPYDMEIGQVVSGKVLNLRGKPYPNSEVILFCHTDNSMSLGVSDENGQFFIDGISFPDSTVFSLQSLNKKGQTKSTEIIPDKEVFPVAHPFIPERTVSQETHMQDYKELTRNRYTEEGNHRVINLDEVEITAMKKVENPYVEMLNTMARSKVTTADIDDKYPGMSFWEILDHQPFVTVDIPNSSAEIRGSFAMFVLDQIPVDNTYMDYIKGNDIEAIHILVDPVAVAMYNSSGKPVICVTLKKGAVNQVESSLGLSTIKPLGFQKPSAFYAPVYEPGVEQSKLPDLRATIHWVPVLVTDESGRIHVKFYTSDKNNAYRVVLEGVSSTGEVYRHSSEMKIMK